MYFTDLQQKKKSSPAGIALVVALHAALGFGIYQSLRFAKVITPSKEIEVVVTPELSEPPPTSSITR